MINFEYKCLFKGDTCKEQLINATNLIIKYKFDSLTSFELRADFNDKFDEVYDDGHFTFGLIDINDLKKHNFEYGYLSGSDLINNVANILKKLLHDCYVYRIGGDEFAFISIISDRIKICKRLHEFDSPLFCYSVLDTDEIKIADHSKRTIFSIADNILKHAKANKSVM